MGALQSWRRFRVLVGARGGCVGAGGASGISGSQCSGFRRRPSDVLDDAVVALGAAVDLREQPPVRAGSVSNRSTQIFTWSMAGSPTDPSARVSSARAPGTVAPRRAASGRRMRRTCRARFSTPRSVAAPEAGRPWSPSTAPPARRPGVVPASSISTDWATNPSIPTTANSPSSMPCGVSV